MKRRISLGVLLLVALCVFGACSKGENGVTESVVNEYNIIANETWFSKKVMVGGVVYPLPLDYSVVKDVIDFESELPETILASEEIKGKWGNSEVSLLLNSAKYGYDTPISDCKITRIVFNNVSASDVDFVLPGGVTFGSTYAEVIKACGEPTITFEKDSDGYYESVYKSEELSIVVTLGYKEDKVVSISIEV